LAQKPTIDKNLHVCFHARMEYTMRRIIPLLLLLLSGCSTAPVEKPNFELAALPQALRPSTFKPEPFISAAISLQAMGREAGSQALLRAAKTADFNDYDKLVVLCRMLFKFREGVNYRSPSLGHRDFFGDTTFADWPLEPIELVNGYPFWIVGLSIGGARSPDAASYYVSYCVTNCDWSTFKYRQLSVPQKRNALAKLLRSPKWNRPLDDGEQSALSSQIE
jgi:hypothetical protein